MISVCMATYNGEKYIKEQIESILMQLNSNDELVISDDGSSDNTLDIIRSMEDTRIRLYSFNSHNYSKNFENAIIHSKGDILFLSDQDDVWEPDKVQSVLDCFEKNNCDLIVTDASIVDAQLCELYDSYFKLCNIRRGFLWNLIGTRYIGACMAFKRQILEDVLPIPIHKEYMAHDYWITLVCEKKYRTCLLDRPVMKYRRHGGNASTGVLEKSKLSLFKRVAKRIYALHLLHKRGI